MSGVSATPEVEMVAERSVEYRIRELRGETETAFMRLEQMVKVVTDEKVQNMEDTITVTAEWENYTNNSNHQKSKGICLVKSMLPQLIENIA